MPNRHIQDANAYRYAYQGQEKDPETGKEAFELRLWDGRIGRWLTTDPAGQYHSPYMGMGNNPINGIDADGGTYNPVVGLDGKTLGATESGMVGDIIVMDASLFSEGMADEIANHVGTTLSQSSNFSEIQKFMISDRINARPDRDGIVTVAEANKWYSEGSGKPLYIDFNQMKFNTSAVSVNDLTLGKKQEINFFNVIDIHPFNSNNKWRPATDHILSRVYGTLRVILLNPNTGEINLERGFAGNVHAFDRYDFNTVDGMFQGKGTGFNFYGYGTGHVRVKPLSGVNPLGGYTGSKL